MDLTFYIIYNLYNIYIYNIYKKYIICVYIHTYFYIYISFLLIRLFDFYLENWDYFLMSAYEKCKLLYVAIFITYQLLIVRGADHREILLRQ